MSECEREGCKKPAHTYQRWGRTVQCPPVGWTMAANATNIWPEPELSLCHDHALEHYGWAVR